MKKVGNKKISKASNAKNVHSIYYNIANKLAKIDIINHVKIYNGRIKASNTLSTNSKKEPIKNTVDENIVVVELLIDVNNKVIQFYTITSSIKGCGEQMVISVLNGAPDDWKIIVLMDWSNGFWNVMTERYPRLIVV